jgi:hypothetical protein
LVRHLVIADLHRLAGSLSSFIVVTNSDAALAAEALGPKAFDRRRPVAGLVVSINVGQQSTYVLDMLSWVKRSQKPKIGFARTSRTAYAMISALTSAMRAPSATPHTLEWISTSGPVRSIGYIHWVDRPKNESVTSNGAVESLGLAVLASHRRLAIVRKLVDNCEICNACDRIPSPLLAIAITESSKETCKDHDYICNDGNKDIGPRKSSEKSKVQK